MRTSAHTQGHMIHPWKRSRLVTTFAIPLLLAHCSGSPRSQISTSQANDTSGNSDTDCRIVLREFGQSTIDGGEVYFNPGGAPFVVYRGVIDVDSSLVATGASVFVWYQANALPSVTVQASQCTTNCENGIQNLNGGQNPPAGFTRYSFATTTNTLEAGDDGYGFNLQLIPYLTLPDGSTLYDHNRTSGNYTDTVSDNFSVCPAPDPQGLDSAPAQQGGTGGSGNSPGSGGGCNQASDCAGALPRNEIQCEDGSFGGASWQCNSNVCGIAYCANDGGPASSPPGGSSLDGGSEGG